MIAHTIRHYAKRFLAWLEARHEDYPPVIDLRRVLIDAQNRTRGGK